MKSELTDIEQEMNEKANEYKDYQLKRKSVYSFIKYYYISQAENLALSRHRQSVLLRFTLNLWKSVIPTLLLEREDEELQEIQRAVLLRRKLVCPRIFHHWRSFIELEKEEKLKEKHTQLMWEKVQGWLRESKETL